MFDFDVISGPTPAALRRMHREAQRPPEPGRAAPVAVTEQRGPQAKENEGKVTPPETA